MKNIFLFIALLFVGSLFAQSPNTPPIGFQSRFQITNVASGTLDTLIISGYVDDCTGRFANSNIAIGDSLYVLEGTDLLIFGVVSNKSISLGIATFKVKDFNGAGITPSTGQAAIFEPTSTIKLPGYVCGLRDDLQQFIMYRLAKNIDANSGGSGDPTMGGDLSGTASNAQIVAGSVGTTELANLNVTLGKLASNSVDSTKIATGGIGNTDLAALIVTGSKIANSTIDSTKIITGGIGNTDLGASIVTSSKIANGTVALIDLANDATIKGNANTAGDTLTNAFQKIVLDVDAGSISTRASGTTTQRTAANAFNVMLANATSSTGGTFTPDLSAGNVFRHTVSSGSTLTVANATNNAGGRVGSVFRTLLKNSSGGSLTVSFGTSWLEQDWTQASNLTLANNDSIILDWKSEFKGGSYVLTAMSDLRGGGTVGIDTISGGYGVLRGKTGSSLSNTIYVNDFSYTYNSVSYTTIGGLFVKASAGLAENGGTVIVANDGTRWKRVFDGVNYFVDWWQVGGRNAPGQPTNYIPTDCGRWDAAARIGGAGSTIIGSGRTYIDCDRANIAYAGQSFVGQEKTVLRARAVQLTRLTANASAGATTISVSDTTGFRVGQDLVIRRGGKRGYSPTLHNKVTITSKGANSITFTPALANNFLTNDTVLVVSRMFSGSGSSSERNWVSFKNMEFDLGWNPHSSTGRRYLHSWAFNEWGEFSSLLLIIDFCKFYNSPCENIFIGKGVVRNCLFGAAATSASAVSKKMAGSAVHGSNTVISQVHTIIVENCMSDSTNQISGDTLGHGKSLFTFSSNNVHFRLIGGSFRNSKGWLNGSDGNDYSFEIVNVEAENFAAIGRHSANAEGNGLRLGDIHIRDSRFKNCGDLVFISVDTSFFRKVNIEGCDFINGRMFANKVKNLTIRNCNFLEKRNNGGTQFTGYAADLGAFAARNTLSYLFISNCPEFMFDGNTVIRDSLNNYSLVRHGMILDMDGVAKTTGGRDYVWQGCTVQNNYFKGFQYSIGNSYNSTEAAQTTRYVGWTYRNNTIVSIDVTGLEGYCLQVGPGVVATGNHLIHATPSANSFYPLFVQGVDASASGTIENNIEGGKAEYNIISGIVNRGIIVGSRGGTVNQYGAICRFNDCVGTITDNSGGFSHVMFNTITSDTGQFGQPSSYVAPIIVNQR